MSRLRPTSRLDGSFMWMDGHALLVEAIVLSSLVGDGGPRRYRQRGRPLPEKYLPGRYFAKLRPEHRAAIARAVNSATPLAPWFLRQIIEAAS